jgi:hypothetical protein
MILDDNEIKERMESPLNLMNRLRRTTKATIPSLPSADELIPDLDDKLKKEDGSLKDKAAGIMSACLDELKIRIPDIQKPEKLAQIATEMNKVLLARKEDPNEHKAAQIVVYAPQVVNESHFETIHVNE